ncbi:MAG: hypothetical protein IJF17_01365 [Thermoguttaceae bacterium]|nr:hypothetical protein [Thermoguttaceae bacterium]MDO4425326.1 hypothetical protein [Planctomycetia bacterium]
MSFSKEMMSKCAKALKFLAPHLEKLTNPSYQLSAADLDTLQKHIQGIVTFFRGCSPAVQKEFFTVRDDVEALYRLDDLITQFRSGTIKLSMKTTLSDIQKRLAGIKVVLNKDLGKARKKSPMGLIILLVIALTVVWFFKETVVSLVESFIKSKPAAEETIDEESTADDESDADTREDADSEISSADEESDKEEPIDTAKETDDEEEKEEVDSTKDDESEKDAEDSDEEKEIGLKTGKFDITSPNRSWTDIKGNKKKGQLVGVEVETEEDITIYLKFNGIEKGFPLDKFSEKDQSYVMKRLEKEQKKAD